MWQHHIPQKFSFESFKSLLGFFLADGRILYFCEVLESIHKFIIEIHVLQCLFIKGSNKKRKDRILQISQKETLFHLLWQTSALVILQCYPLPASYKKGFHLLLNLVKKRMYLSTQWTGELTDFFWKLTGFSLFS